MVDSIGDIATVSDDIWNMRHCHWMIADFEDIDTGLGQLLGLLPNSGDI